MPRLGNHAIVIGGSIAGLIAARVLSDYFDQGTIFDRDRIEDSTVVRKSVPQANHLHGLLQGGERVLTAFYPGFLEQLQRLGAARLMMGRDVVWRLPDGKAYSPSGSLREPHDFGFEGHLASRGLIELLIRRRTLALPNVQFESGAAVRELAHRHGHVRGVCREGFGSIEADLVVDATGRGSRAPRWLESMGFVRPAETTIGVDAAYSSAFYRRPQTYDSEPLVFITGPPPAFTRRGYAAAIEEEILLVGVVGAFGDYPPTNEAELLGYAEQLHCSFIADLMKSCERLSTIAHHRFPLSVQRHYERMPSFPEGLLILGDALCCFNPIHAQGMSTAALHAEALQEALAERSRQSHGLDGLASLFFSKAAELNSTPWMLAAGFDFAFPQTRGERPPGMEERARYFRTLDLLSSEDIDVQRLVIEVFQLLRPVSALQEEPLRNRVLAYMRAHRDSISQADHEIPNLNGAR
jgi:2-polyprenyl-6-methoxyphenol hydroxylase-like FAD-dependent oxidoreductase